MPGFGGDAIGGKGMANDRETGKLPDRVLSQAQTHKGKVDSQGESSAVSGSLTHVYISVRPVNFASQAGMKYSLGYHGLSETTPST